MCPSGLAIPNEPASLPVPAKRLISCAAHSTESRNSNKHLMEQLEAPYSGPLNFTDHTRSHMSHTISRQQPHSQSHTLTLTQTTPVKHHSAGSRRELHTPLYHLKPPAAAHLFHHLFDCCLPLLAANATLDPSLLDHVLLQLLY